MRQSSGTAEMAEAAAVVINIVVCLHHSTHRKRITATLLTCKYFSYLDGIYEAGTL
jgi:hypothetical protein